MKDLGEVQTVVLGKDPGVLIGEPKVATSTPEDDVCAPLSGSEVSPRGRGEDGHPRDSGWSSD